MDGVEPAGLVKALVQPAAVPGPAFGITVVGLGPFQFFFQISVQFFQTARLSGPGALGPLPQCVHQRTAFYVLRLPAGHKFHGRKCGGTQGRLPQKQPEELHFSGLNGTAVQPALEHARPRRQERHIRPQRPLIHGEGNLHPASGQNAIVKGQKRLVFFGNAKFQMDFDLVVGLRLQGHDGGLLSLPALWQGGGQ